MDFGSKVASTGAVDTALFFLGGGPLGWLISGSFEVETEFPFFLSYDCACLTTFIDFATFEMSVAMFLSYS